jgi:hypothetical protein
MLDRKTLTYPYVPGERGIHPDEFRLHGKREIQAESGARLLVINIPGDITISSIDHPHLRMRGYFTFGAFKADLRTIHDGFRIVDLRAQEFIETVFPLIDTSHGPIQIFRGEWWGTSENYDRFMRNYRRTKDPLEAANSTWSAEVMGRFGFRIRDQRDVTLTESLKREDTIIKATFHRDNLTPIP